MQSLSDSWASCILSSLFRNPCRQWTASCVDDVFFYICCVTLSAVWNLHVRCLLSLVQYSAVSSSAVRKCSKQQRKLCCRSSHWSCSCSLGQNGVMPGTHTPLRSLPKQRSEVLTVTASAETNVSSTDDVDCLLRNLHKEQLQGSLVLCN